MYSKEEIEKGKTIIKVILITLLSVIFIITAVSITIPMYKVWKAKQSGLAKVEAARSEAKAMSIINSQLTQQYIYYLWVNKLGDIDAEKIIIPTDNNFPAMEDWMKHDRQYYRQSD